MVETLALMGERSVAVPDAPREHLGLQSTARTRADQPELRPGQREPVGGERGR